MVCTCFLGYSEDFLRKSVADARKTGIVKLYKFVFYFNTDSLKDCED